MHEKGRKREVMLLNMSHRNTFFVVLFSLLPFFAFMTSCEKLKREYRAEMTQGQREHISVATCCWCVDANTNANVVMSYISPAECEDAVADPSRALANCKKVQVDAQRCSLHKVTKIFDPNTNTFGERRTNEDLKIHGKDEFIKTLAPVPNHCNRGITELGAKSSDPRCDSESCKCYADETFPWNCELVMFKNGRKESLGKRAKLDRGALCDATTCKELFAKEVRSFCPTVE